MPAPKNNAATSANDALMDKMELLISRLLLGGVLTSMATIVVGVVLMFAHHPDYLKSAADLQRLTSPGAAFPHTLEGVANGILTGRGQAVVALGLIFLIATPILRVAVSILGFVLQRDRTFALISAAVLLVLLISFLLGKVE